MTSLRERIDAKQRRTANLPILVGNPSSAAAEVETFRAALSVHQQAVKGRVEAGGERTEADSATEERLRGQLAAAKQKLADCVVEVELQSLPRDEWDAMFDDLEESDEGGLDLTSIQAQLLAASCVDEDLQDVDWWETTLARPEWTRGDRGAISQKLLELNAYSPVAGLGKD